jgi:hypothetical protein
MWDKKNNRLPLFILVFFLVGVLLIIILIVSNKKFDKQLSDSLKVQKSAFMALNTDKSVYLVGEPVYIYVSAIDKEGNTLCKCDLDINVLGPDGGEVSLSTSKGDISIATACSGNGGKTNDPDYQSYFNALKEGQYNIRITDLNSNLTAQKTVDVTGEAEISVSRYGTTRVNPSETERYHMVIKVISKEGFKGILQEFISLSFDVVWKGEASVENIDESQVEKISWDLDLKPGEIKELKYDYVVPKADAQVFNLGKVIILGSNSDKIFEEKDPWNLTVGKELNLIIVE